jgi:hypothetical protein
MMDALRISVLPTAIRKHDYNVLCAALSLLLQLTKHRDGRERLLRFRLLDVVTQASQVKHNPVCVLATAVLYNASAQRNLETSLPRLLPPLLKLAQATEDNVRNLATRAVQLIATGYQGYLDRVKLAPVLQAQLQPYVKAG